MFPSSTRRKPSRHDSYTTAIQSRFNPRSTSPQRNRRSHIPRLITFVAALGSIVLFLCWAIGFRDDSKVRIGGGVKVVARDWESINTRSPNRWKQGLGRDRSDGFKRVESNIAFVNARKQEVVLILCPMKNSIEHIWHFFHSLDSLNYPRHLIQLGILVSDSKDRTYERALELADERQYSRKKKEQYGRISVFRKDFVDEEKFIATKADAEVPALAVKDLEKGSDEMSNVGKARHSFSFQKYRRSLLARSRSWLLLSALAPEVDYVLWMDVDVVQYENDLLQTLIGWSEKENADVVAPNCMWKSYNEMGSYDLNNWSETPESLAMKALLKPDDVLIEGYPDLITHRKTLASYYPPTDTTPNVVNLDGVGGCTVLVKAAIHRAGAVFPAYAFQNQMETEGFGQMVKKLAGKMIGLPKYYVFHGLYG